MSSITATTLVPLHPATGMELTAQIPFQKRPTRLQTRFKTLKKYVAQYPRGWKKRLELADVLYGLGQWSEAAQEYRIVLERQPHLLTVRLQLGQILRMLDRSQEAIALYQGALDQTMDCATRNHLEGMIYECQQHHASATLAYQKAIDAETTNAAHWYALAQSYIQQDRVEAAIHTYDKIFALQPEDAIALSRSADLLWGLSAYPESMRRTERVLAIAPDHAPAVKRQLDHRCRTGLVNGPEKAITEKLLKQLQTLSPHTPELIQSQAYFQFYQGDSTWGRQQFADYCREHPNNPFGWYYNAGFLYDMGEISAAAASIGQAYQLCPTDRGIFQHLCQLLTLTQQDVNLKQALETAIKTGYGSLDLIAGRTLVEHYAEIQRGCDLAKNAVQRQPDHAEAWFQYGEVLALSQHYQDAITAIERGWTRLSSQWFCASSIPAAVSMATCYQALGNTDQAVSWWHEVLERSQLLCPFFPRKSKGWQNRATQGLAALDSAKI